MCPSTFSDHKGSTSKTIVTKNKGHHNIIDKVISLTGRQTAPHPPIKTLAHAAAQNRTDNVPSRHPVDCHHSITVEMLSVGGRNMLYRQSVTNDESVGCDL